MGRTASMENKSEFVKLRVKPSLKNEVQSFREGSKYQDVQEQDFLAMLLRAGLEVEKVERGWHADAIAIVAKHPRESADPAGRRKVP